MSKNGEAPVNAKIVLCGNSNVGKTCILTRFYNNVYNENNKSTIGVEFVVTLMKAPTSGREYKLQIWDTAGQERYFSLIQSYFRGASVILFVFDVTRHESFDGIPRWVTHAEIDKNPLVIPILLGNKADLETHREVTEQEALSFAQKHKMHYMETSAKTGAMVKEEFERIVDLVDEMHQIKSKLGATDDSSAGEEEEETVSLLTSIKNKKCCF